VASLGIEPATFRLISQCLNCASFSNCTKINTGDSDNQTNRGELFFLEPIAKGGASDMQHSSDVTAVAVISKISKKESYWAGDKMFYQNIRFLTKDNSSRGAY